MTVEGQDGFGQSLFWWARRTGNLRVLQLLLQHAEKTGSPVPDDLAPVNATPLFRLILNPIGATPVH